MSAVPLFPSTGRNYWGLLRDHKSQSLSKCMCFRFSLSFLDFSRRCRHVKKNAVLWLAVTFRHCILDASCIPTLELFRGVLSKGIGNVCPSAGSTFRRFRTRVATSPPASRGDGIPARLLNCCQAWVSLPWRRRRWTVRTSHMDCSQTSATPRALQGKG